MAPVPELVSETPLRLYIPQGLEARARELLSVTDRSADYELKRLRRTKPWRRPKDPNGYDAEEKRLLTKRDRVLLFPDGDRLWTYTGLRDYLATELLRPVGITLTHRRAYDLPDPQGIPWKRTPREVFGREPHLHQAQGAEVLVVAGHGSAEFATGSGKTLLFALAIRTLGLRTALVVYSTAVAEQLYGVLCQLLGEKYVGTFDGDHKAVGKLVTVCTALSVANLKPDSKAYDWFAGCQVLCGDESHTFAAATLLSLSEGVFAAAPYRLFASATQVRGDGLDLILLGVVGPTVAEKTFREAVNEGFLARPSFFMLGVRSDSEYESGDLDRMTREHVYLNESLARDIGQVVAAYRSAGWQVLVLAEEFPQVVLLLRHLPATTKVLHGNTGEQRVVVHLDGYDPVEVSSRKLLDSSQGLVEATTLARTFGPTTTVLDAETKPCSVMDCYEVGTGQFLLPVALRDCDARQLAQEFSSGDLGVLVSTSAGRVGVDLTPPSPTLVVYLVAGTSEVAFVQGVGRGARRKGKAVFHVLDCRVLGQDRLGRHADRRAELAEELWEKPREVGVEEMLSLVGGLHDH